jgi:hypothetical protein
MADSSQQPEELAGEAQTVGDDSSTIIHAAANINPEDTPRFGDNGNQVTPGAIPKFKRDPYKELPSLPGKPTAVSPLRSGWSDSAEGGDSDGGGAE